MKTQIYATPAVKGLTDFFKSTQLLLFAFAGHISCPFSAHVRMITMFLCYHRDNFLQIDIFYRQLSYEQVTEQKAFELLSLFSEVGGFMGLLLGASILTVCELIDYIIISARMKCNAADKNTKKQQDNRRKKGTNGNINDGLEVAEVQVDVKD